MNGIRYSVGITSIICWVTILFGGITGIHASDSSFAPGDVQGVRIGAERNEGESMEENGKSPAEDMPLRAMVIVFSYHHKNTEKIAQVFSKALAAPMRTPQQITPEELQGYDLLGFGSGIYSAKHHESILALADKLPPGNGKKVFIFSTFGAPASLLDEKEFRKLVGKNHSPLRSKLQARGYEVVDEFSCPGFNTNSFLKIFGGLNKGRPNAEDLKRAEEFILSLKRRK